MTAQQEEKKKKPLLLLNITFIAIINQGQKVHIAQGAHNKKPKPMLGVACICPGLPPEHTK